MLDGTKFVLSVNGVVVDHEMAARLKERLKNVAGSRESEM